MHEWNTLYHGTCYMTTCVSALLGMSQARVCSRYDPATSCSIFRAYNIICKGNGTVSRSSWVWLTNIYCTGTCQCRDTSIAHQRRWAMLMGWILMRRARDRDKCYTQNTVLPFSLDNAELLVRNWPDLILARKSAGSWRHLVTFLACEATTVIHDTARLYPTRIVVPRIASWGHRLENCTLSFLPRQSD